MVKLAISGLLLGAGILLNSVGTITAAETGKGNRMGTASPDKPISMKWERDGKWAEVDLYVSDNPNKPAGTPKSAGKIGFSCLEKSFPEYRLSTGITSFAIDNPNNDPRIPDIFEVKFSKDGLVAPEYSVWISNHLVDASRKFKRGTSAASYVKVFVNGQQAFLPLGDFEDRYNGTALACKENARKRSARQALKRPVLSVRPFVPCGQTAPGQKPVPARTG